MCAGVCVFAGSGVDTFVAETSYGSVLIVWLLACAAKVTRIGAEARRDVKRCSLPEAFFWRGGCAGESVLVQLPVLLFRSSMTERGVGHQLWFLLSYEQGSVGQEDLDVLTLAAAKASARALELVGPPGTLKAGEGNESFPRRDVTSGPVRESAAVVVDATGSVDHKVTEVVRAFLCQDMLCPGSSMAGPSHQGLPGRSRGGPRRPGCYRHRPAVRYKIRPGLNPGYRDISPQVSVRYHSCSCVLRFTSALFVASAFRQ
ncbi:hypothetical protein HPB50_025773 [Hyalomma asiaticum]|uniref:Uncharacterized protein n=1 Tax=Hyalomma asiaticum TaxID=266040 RepID=A0ACB7RRR1_HYAAI|nr:hypothetical protein HPB50_025773 [Hyalomma asiaticum]